MVRSDDPLSSSDTLMAFRNLSSQMLGDDPIDLFSNRLAELVNLKSATAPTTLTPMLSKVIYFATPSFPIGRCSFKHYFQITTI